MKFHYMGKFSGNEEQLPQREHAEGHVPFKEPESRKFALIANVGSLALFVLTLGLLFLRGGVRAYSLAGALLSLVSLVPHELLHAACFKEDVCMYQWLSHGLLFVAGPEDMTKGRFVFMSLLPNLVFGFIPYILFIINPSLRVLGTMGAMAIAMGFGDYINVYNALTQMPKGALTYMKGFHSYWYMPGAQG